MSEHFQCSGAPQPAKRRITTKSLRRATRLTALVIFMSLLLAAKETSLPLFAPALSPLVAIASIITTRTFVGIHLLGLFVLGIAAWRRRWFCHWVCPTGLCADQASAQGRRMKRRGPRLPAMGPGIAIFILASACVGYPLFLWLDPLALLGAAVTPLTTPHHPSAWLFSAGILAVLILSFVWPNIWCGQLCPLGGLQEVTYRIRRLIVRAASPDAKQNRQLSTKKPLVVERRTLFAVVAGLGWGVVARTVCGRGSTPVRPPGSVDASRFSALCIRCGNCVRSCPTHVITHEWGEHGLAGLMTPKMDFRDDYCFESCNACTAVCPSGAIQPISIDEKIHAKMGIAVVNMEICLLGDDRECAICRNRCPYGAISLDFDDELYTLTPRVDLSRCPGCGACETACPTQPVKAILVRSCQWSR